MQKSKQNSEKENIKEKSLIEDAKKFFIFFVFAYGGILIFSYCFSDIKFYPSGLSATDILFFTFVALGLAVFAYLSAALGMIFFIPYIVFDNISDIKNDTLKGKTKNFLIDGKLIINPILILLVATLFIEFNFFQNKIGSKIFICIALAIWILLFISYISCARILYIEDRKKFYSNSVIDLGFVHLFAGPFIAILLFGLSYSSSGLIIGVVLGGFFLTILLNQLQVLEKHVFIRRQSNNNILQFQRKRFFAIILILAIATPPVFVSQIRKAVFTQLGIRTESASISVSSKNYDLLNAVANAGGVSLSICRSGDSDPIVSPVDVLWHGVGERTLIEMKGLDKVHMELESEGVKLISGNLEQCINIPEAGIFESGSSKFVSTYPGNQIEELKLSLKKDIMSAINGRNIDLFEVIGHSDPMISKTINNHELAKKRAEAVSNLILSLDFIKNTNIKEKMKFKSEGSSKSIKQCDESKSQQLQRECNEANRRVEIRIKFEAKNK